MGAAPGGLGAGVSVLVGIYSLSERLVSSLLTDGSVDFRSVSSLACCSASFSFRSL